MRIGGKRALTVVAIYAIALHAILWGAVSPQAAAYDPFSVICHSDGADPAGQSPESPSPTPAHACDHCNLCSGGPTPITLVPIFAGQLAPARLLQILRPASSANGRHFVTDIHFARGPPHFA
jgi:DUF2946 family protein